MLGILRCRVALGTVAKPEWRLLDTWMKASSQTNICAQSLYFQTTYWNIPCHHHAEKAPRLTRTSYTLELHRANPKLAK